MLWGVLRVVLAVALLAWAAHQVHWRDYVEFEGKSYPVLQITSRSVGDFATIAVGPFWASHEQTVPMDRCSPIRPGLWSTLRGLAVFPVAVAALCVVASTLVASLRLRELLWLQGIRLGAGEALRLGLLGEFFASMMPGTMGGELAKGYYIARGRSQTAAVVVSIFADRFVGLCGFTALAAVMLVVAWLTGAAGDLIPPAISVGAVIVGGGVALALVLSSRLRRLLHLQKIYALPWLAPHVAAAREAVGVLLRSGRRLPLVAGMTLAAQALGILAIAAVGITMELDLAWYEYFLYVSLITIISAVPVTPGSVGVMEQLYVVYLAHAASPSKALALALTARALMLVSAALGGLIYAFGLRLRRPADAATG